MVYVIATYLYFKALEKTDASIIAVMFQLIPVFSYILGLIFFNETLSFNQIIGGVIIILASIVISVDFDEKNNKSKILALVLMLMSSFCSALYYILFEIAMKNSSYNSTVFWYQIGLLLIGIGLLVLKSYRQDFFLMMKVNGKKFISINVANEGLNLMAHFMLNFANLTLPIALANIVANGFNGAFVFVIGAIGVALFPKVFSEDLSKKVVLQKVGCIILGIVGMAIMFG
jgi:drug/metabolite transporter (DMT)-like permease